MNAASGQPISCALAEERLMLRLYDELSPEEAEVLDAHLVDCENCRRELAALRALEETLAAEPPAEPSQHLLAEARERLDNALDSAGSRQSTRNQSWSGRFFRPMLASFRPSGQGMQAAPFAVAAMLLVGIGAGGVSGYRLGVNAHPPSAPPTPVNLVPLATSPVASVSSVVTQPDGKSVLVRYNRLVPESITGSADNANIRQLLAMGIQSPTAPEVQDAAARTLADTCAHGPECEDMRLRGALLTAARYDGDAALRGKALSTLQPYIAEDMRVRDMALYSLTHDASTTVRATAMEMLHPVEGDSSVLQTLQSVSNTDHDPRIRSQSQQMWKDASDVEEQIH